MSKSQGQGHGVRSHGQGHRVKVKATVCIVLAAGLKGNVVMTFVTSHRETHKTHEYTTTDTF